MGGKGDDVARWTPVDRSGFADGFVEPEHFRGEFGPQGFRFLGRQPGAGQRVEAHFPQRGLGEVAPGRGVRGTDTGEGVQQLGADVGDKPGAGRLDRLRCRNCVEQVGLGGKQVGLAGESLGSHGGEYSEAPQAGEALRADVPAAHPSGMSDSWRRHLPELLANLARRPGHETVRTHLSELLRHGLGVPFSEIAHEVRLQAVRGRADTLFGSWRGETRRHAPLQLALSSASATSYGKAQRGGEALRRPA